MDEQQLRRELRALATLVGETGAKLMESGAASGRDELRSLGRGMVEASLRVLALLDNDRA